MSFPHLSPVLVWFLAGVVFFALANAWMLVRARKARAGLPAPGLR